MRDTSLTNVIIGLFVVVTAVFCSTPAFAYIDPGTGGAIYSLLAPIVGFALVILAFILGYLKGTYSFIKELFNRLTR